MRTEEERLARTDAVRSKHASTQRRWLHWHGYGQHLAKDRHNLLEAMNRWCLVARSERRQRAALVAGTAALTTANRTLGSCPQLRKYAFRAWKRVTRDEIDLVLAERVRKMESLVDHIPAADGLFAGDLDDEDSSQSEEGDEEALDTANAPSAHRVQNITTRSSIPEPKPREAVVLDAALPSGKAKHLAAGGDGNMLDPNWFAAQLSRFSFGLETPLTTT